jgi:UDP-N-acetylmuramate dehydrogenase
MEIKREMDSKWGGADFIENAPMSRYTSFKAGGNAKALVEVHNEQQLKAILQIVSEKNIPHMMLGNGSNTLFKDSGYDGIVIKLGSEFAYGKVLGDVENAKIGDSVLVSGGAAILMSTFARFLLKNSLAGFEFASGIPGSLGGALFMNAGAYGGEMKELVKSVRAISPDGLEERIFTCEEMGFGYRHSNLGENGYIAIEAILELKKGDHDVIASQMKELLTKRNSKQPVTYPSAGSTFKRPTGHFAGQLIENAGLKGVSIGGAEVSVLHSGFVINKGNATATDILDLINLIQNRVYDETGIMLEPEVRIIG